MAPLTRLARRAYSRRDFVASTMAAGMASCAVGRLSLPACAQGELDEVAAAIDANREEAALLLDEVLHKIDAGFGERTADAISERHYQLRLELASLLYPLPQASQRMLVDPDYTFLVSTISRYDIPLVHRPISLQQVDINQISVATAQDTCNRYLAIVFIVSAVLDLPSEAFVELIRGTSVEAKLQQLVDDAPNKSWEEIASIVDGILVAISGPEFIARASLFLRRARAQSNVDQYTPLSCAVGGLDVCRNYNLRSC